MKKFQLPIILILLAGFLSLTAYHFFKREKIVYVDITKLLQEYKGMKDAREVFEQKMIGWKSRQDTLLTEWQNELKAYEKERISLNSKERMLREELLQNKQDKIANYQEAIKLQKEQEEHKLTMSVINRINEYLTEFGKQKGYTFILGATGTGNIVYADESRDITDIILKGLQEEYEKEHK